MGNLFGFESFFFFPNLFKGHKTPGPLNSFFGVAFSIQRPWCILGSEGTISREEVGAGKKSENGKTLNMFKTP